MSPREGCDGPNPVSPNLEQSISMLAAARFTGQSSRRDPLAEPALCGWLVCNPTLCLCGRREECTAVFHHDRPLGDPGSMEEQRISIGAALEED